MFVRFWPDLPGIGLHGGRAHLFSSNSTNRKDSRLVPEV